MERFCLIENSNPAHIFVEKEAFEGVWDIARTVAEDMELVCGNKPAIFDSIEESKSDNILIFATLGHSALLERLAREGWIDLSAVSGKREVYMQMILSGSALGLQGKQLCLVAGSDKRGTIYGMFRISEQCGVSPLVYFGDAYPSYKSNVEIKLETPFLSKEPSVKYRGFFINDEWPAFGNWATEKFGDVNAKAYKKIFELLLRLKGNYMWPAMWNSSFSEDGPGLQNAVLADKLGVIMGLSHHEPMCRSGVEWQRIYQQYGEDSTWSFVSNQEAITAFWKDGILRNREFENVITIGMRGENDSKLMGEDATLKDNIEVIKGAILTQHRLIRENMDANLKEIPRMLAIYKEVEDYYEGDETCEGLKDWEELSDVIFLLSDDNHGNLRGLPDEKTRNHPGGFGMYYHFDYHGAPISYEWNNCNRLTKTWEQMTQAYEAGVREMWIVNVGDLKGVEYPLNYFMDLAYDFEALGSSAPNQIESYVRAWIDKQFTDGLTPAQKKDVADILEGYTRWNFVRTPETMNDKIYHPVFFRECDRVWEEVHELIQKADRLREELREGKNKHALCTYESMIYYQAVTSMNLILMYTDASRNKELARRGVLAANTFANRVRKHILRDAELVREFHQSNEGKWNYMMASYHTGFRSWDAYDWTYPTVETVMPIPEAKAVVSFRGSDKMHLGTHWQGATPLVNSDFASGKTAEVILDLDSRGAIPFSYEIQYESRWLQCDAPKGTVDQNQEFEGRKSIIFTVNREFIEGPCESEAVVNIHFENGQESSTKLLIKADSLPKEGAHELRNGFCVMKACDYAAKEDLDNQGFRVIQYLGREGSAIKAFPSMMNFLNSFNIFSSFLL